MDSTWYKDAVFYELYVRAFKDSSGDGNGDLRGVLSRLDYLQQLGVDCIWLLPVNPSPLRDDGYDVADYLNIHSDFGTLEDFKALVGGVHQRGMRIIVDVVVNHTSDQHPWFIESRSSKTAAKRDWYVWSDTDQRYADTRVIFKDTEQSNWTRDPVTGEYYWHRFYTEQPDLNYDNPDVQQAILDIMDYWLGMGIDGFRVDAVPYLFERENTTCENLPETHQYVRRLRKHFDTQWPGRIMLAEANQWPQDVREYFGDNDEFHMAFHFPIMPRLFMALKQRTRKSIVDILNRTPAIPPSAQWCIFLRNHDELTLEMVTEDERQYMWEQYAPDDRMRLNLGIRRRLAPLLDNDQRRVRLLNALLFSLPGSPIIYYGDEIGMGDNVQLPDRNGVRTPMQWDSSKNAGFSDVDAPYVPVIDDADFGYRRVNVSGQQADPGSLWYVMRHMLTVRKQYRAFGRGAFEFALPDNEAILGYWRVYTGDSVPATGANTERFLVLVNLTDEPQRSEIDLSEFAGRTPTDVLTPDQSWPEITEASYVFELAPYAYHWLRI
ncbi:MAG: maltose alpha-D-glucosyltransferase [Anaerolineae bacterium]|nr:maltose alpha-D-glucosyltransferase [Anaerolineae bacterium]